MLQNARTLRRVVTALVVMGALLVAPTSAMAYVDLSGTLKKLDEVTASGAVSNFQLEVTNNGDEATTEATNVYISTGEWREVRDAEDNPTGVWTSYKPEITNAFVHDVVGNAELSTAGALDHLVVAGEFAAGFPYRGFQIKPGLKAGAKLVVTVPVTLPKRKDSLSLGAQNATGHWFYESTPQVRDIRIISDSRVNVIHQPSVPSVGVSNKWVQVGGTVTQTATVTNFGSQPANYVMLNADTSAHASEFSPTHWPNPEFKPATKFVEGSQCVGTMDNSWCFIESIPAGGSITVVTQTTDITHYGTLRPSVSVMSTADVVPGEWCDEGVACYDDAPRDDAGFKFGNDYIGGVPAKTLFVTDGATIKSNVRMVGPKVAPGLTPLTYSGEFVNSGDEVLKNGVLRIDATSFGLDGASHFSASADDPTIVPSITAISFSNGATCVRDIDYTEKYDGARDIATGRITDIEAKTFADRYNCSLVNIAPGERLSFTVVANFHSLRNDATTTDTEWTSGKFENPQVSAALLSTAFAKSTIGDAYVSTRLNRALSADLDVSVSSGAMIGAKRIGTHTVTITNKGNLAAQHVRLYGSIDAKAGQFDQKLLPKACAGTVKVATTSCHVEDIAPGASVKLSIPVRAGAKLQTLVSSFSVSTSEFDSNDDNDQVYHSTQIVKANAVILPGVKVAKAKSATLATVAKKGFKSTVTVPNYARVRVDLTLPYAQAVKLNLIKARKGKKPATIVVGTAQKVRKNKGKVTVTTKFNKKYSKKLAASTKTVSFKRVTTVLSLSSETKDATSVTTQTVKMTAKKAKKGKR